MSKISKMKELKKKIQLTHGETEYVLQMKRGCKWCWLLLLLLLPLLLLIPQKKTVFVQTIDPKQNQLIENVNVYFQYDKQSMRIAGNDYFSYTRKTSEKGPVSFYHLRYRLASWIFKHNSKIKVTASSKCYGSDTLEVNFHKVKNNETLKLSLYTALRDISFIVVDANDTKHKLTNAKVMLESPDRSFIDSAYTDSAGLVKFTEIPRCITINVEGTKKGWRKDTLELSNNQTNFIDTLYLKKESEPLPPEKNCRAFFTGRLVGEKVTNSKGLCIPYFEDQWSEYVGSGFYPNNRTAFPKAVASSFDGIAIDAGTRVIIYSKKNFQGEILLDQKGPIIINNKIFKSSYGYCNTITFPDTAVQKIFPPKVRQWSKSDMQSWSYGSLKIICD